MLLTGQLTSARRQASCMELVSVGPKHQRQTWSADRRCAGTGPQNAFREKSQVVCLLVIPWLLMLLMLRISRPRVQLWTQVCRFEGCLTLFLEKMEWDCRPRVPRGEEERSAREIDPKKFLSSSVISSACKAREIEGSRNSRALEAGTRVTGLRT